MTRLISNASFVLLSFDSLKDIYLFVGQCSTVLNHFFLIYHTMHVFYFFNYQNNWGLGYAL